eukprot:5625893-Pyramimonas_sp.AAC.1
MRAHSDARPPFSAGMGELRIKARAIDAKERCKNSSLQQPIITNRPNCEGGGCDRSRESARQRNTVEALTSHWLPGGATSS